MFDRVGAVTIADLPRLRQVVLDAYDGG